MFAATAGVTTVEETSVALKTNPRDLIVQSALCNPHCAIRGPRLAPPETPPLARQARPRHRKRALTVAMMAERIGPDEGFGDAIGDLVVPRGDDVCLLLDAERLPKRVRPRKAPIAL